MIHTSSATSTGPGQVLVLMGSVRPGRRCPQIAAWVIGIAKASTELQYELIDLADWPLPMDGEPGIPEAHLGYSHEHTRAWSRKISAASAFVFVTPQYNWGYPAVLKNAIDHLYKEWQGKPVAIVTYGGHGGSKCAAQLRQVTEGINMRPTTTMPGIRLTRKMIEGGPLDPERDFRADEAEMIRRALRELSAQLEPDTAA